MIERAILYETAILAKEKGFTLDFASAGMCDYYKPDGSKLRLQEWNKEFVKFCTLFCSQTILQKWLRETHFLQVGVDRDEDYWTPKLLEFRHGNKYKAFPIMSESYETAMEAGLQEALKLIVCKKN